MSFRRRTYPEVRDNVLTALISGVAGEEHPFPPGAETDPEPIHFLKRSEPAQIISVFGSVAGQPHQFQAGADFAVIEQGRAIQWLAKGQLPDPGTIVNISYVPRSAQPAITDLNVGSVIRTVAESISLEIARVYAELEAVYHSGFVDTATARSLDNVVSLLGVDRIRGGRASGEIELTRAQGSRGQIVIPAGTRVINQDGSVEYESVATAVMAPGQNAVRIGVRDLEPNDPVPADTLVVLPVPIAGIASVTNPVATAIGTLDETDEQLRARAKAFLNGNERATLGAIRAAIERQGVSADVSEPTDPGSLGRIIITLHAGSELSPEQDMRIRAAVEEFRPAGVLVEWAGAVPPRRVNLSMRLVTPPELIADDLRRVQKQVRDRVSGYFAALPARESASLGKLTSLAIGVPGVQDARITAATWIADGAEESVLDAAAGLLRVDGSPTTLGDLHIADPNLATRVNVIARYPSDPPDLTPPDESAIRAAVSQALAAVSAINESDPPAAPTPADLQRRTITYARLLAVVPLPGHAAVTVDQFDEAANGEEPAAPAISPYIIEFTVTSESGISRVLSASGPAAYSLAPFERLTLSGVQVAKTGPGGGNG